MGKHPWFTASRRAIWVSLCIAVVSILILVACGTTTATNPTPPPQQPTIVQVVPTPTPVPPISQATTVIVQMLESPPGHYFFKPDTLTITAGTVIVWVDNSDAPHTVTSDPNAPNPFNTTSNVTQGKTFSLIFNTPGTYNYHCNIHPNMKAVITVTS